MKRLFSIILCVLLTVLANAKIDLTGKALVYDSRTKSYLCSVPESLFDDGSVTAFTCDTATIKFTFLPIIRIHGTFSNDYAPGSVDLFMPDDSDQQAMLAKLKWHGGSSNTNETHKRNYHVKFLDADGSKQDRKFFGLRKDNSWLLNAASSDLSRVRNQAAIDIWNEFSTRPYYVTKEPKAITAPRGSYVELFLNDEYMGIYDMMEDTDRSLLKLKKYDDDNTIHGQLWKSKGFTYTNFWSYDDYDNNLETWGSYETKYPDIEDICPTDYSTLYNFVKLVVDGDSTTLAKVVDDYIDVPELIDLFTFLYFVSAQDNYAGKNFLIACYDRQEDKKLVMLPWDLDCTIGRYFKPGELDEYLLQPETHDDCFWGNQLFYHMDNWNINGFHDKCEARWKELRQTLFTKENIISHYTRYMDALAKSGAYDRETALWNQDSDVFGQTLDFASEENFIKDWISRRIDAIDQYGLPTSISNVTVNTKNGKVYNVQGIRVNTPKAPGIYIRNGKKFVVR